MKYLRIAEGVRLPIDVVTETISVLAKRGAGKTYTANVIVEEMLRAGAQVVVVDPMGAWWGLRSSSSGDEPGFPVSILGGEHGDVPLEHTAGHVVAETVVSSGISVVLDVSTFSKGQRKRFVQEFAETLYRKNREPVHVVLEEADLFAPQKPQRGEEPMLGAIEDLVRRGRGKGIGVSLITQRSAVLNKDVLSQTEILIALRTTSPHDRKAVEAWLEWHLEKAELAAIMRDLPTLETGEAFIVSPSVLRYVKRVRIRERTTYDSSATPKAGARAVTPRVAADVDLDALREAMAETVEKAEANDPKKLRARISELEKALESNYERGREAGLAEAESQEPETVPVVFVPGGVIEAVEEIVSSLETVKERLEKGAEVGQEQVEEIIRRRGGGEVRRPVASEPTRTISRRPTAEVPATAPNALEVDLSKGARKILETAARFRSLSRSQLLTLAGYSPKSSTPGEHLSTLVRGAFLVKNGDRYEATEYGRNAVGVTAPPRDAAPSEILGAWLAVLPSGAQRLLETLVADPEAGITRGDLFESAGFSRNSSTPGEYLSLLRSNDLVVSEDGLLYPAEELVG